MWLFGSNQSMTRITTRTTLRHASSFLGAALFALAISLTAAPEAEADGIFAPCDRTKTGTSGQCYQWKKDC